MSYPQYNDKEGYNALIMTSWNSDNMGEIILELIKTGQSNPQQVSIDKCSALIEVCK